MDTTDWKITERLSELACFQLKCPACFSILMHKFNRDRECPICGASFDVCEPVPHYSHPCSMVERELTDKEKGT